MKSRNRNSNSHSLWQIVFRAPRRSVWQFVAAFLSTVSFLAHAQNFSDDFTRATNSASILPWQNQAGNWVITNGVFRGGPNASDTYGFAYITNSLTNCTVSAQFSAPSTGFGYGLGVRVNPSSGAHYGVWIYPDNSPFTPDRLKLIKFPDWGTSSFTIVQDVSSGVLGTGIHTLTVVCDTNLINVYLDGAVSPNISYTDNSSPYLTGGVSVDMYTFGSDIYTLTVDNVIAGPINYPPASIKDSFTLRGDTAQTVTAPGVLYNDMDPDNTNLIAILVSTTTNGLLSFSSNGGFTYTLTNASAVNDSFTYKATDGSSTSAVANVVLTLTAGGAFFSDNFSRATNPASLVPWTAHSGNWAITNDVLQGGTNTYPLYGTLYHDGNWSDYAVEASFAFPPEAYGGGIAGRLNASTGTRYAAWIYPENSPRGPNRVRLVKFQSWDTYGYDNFSNAHEIVNIPLSSVGTNWHTLKLAFEGDLISLQHNGTILTNVMDNDALLLTFPRYTNGGVSVDFYGFTNSYVMHADDVSVRPLVSDDNYVMNEGTQLTIASGGVLTNDTGFSGAGLTAVLVGGPAHGTLNLNANGSFDYTPAANFVGIDSFTYEARDGANSLGAAIVNITVESVNQAPQLPSQPDYTVVAGSTLTLTNQATDTDVGDILSYALVDPPNGVAITTNGVITWTPTLAQSASTNIITTIVTDNGVPALSDTNSITVVVTQPAGTYLLGAFFENFDGVTAPNLPAGWTTSQTDNQLIWFTQTSQRDSLPNAVFSPEPATNGVNELVTPAINLPVGQFQLRFRNQYNLESHPISSGLAFDGGVLEIKIGAGSFTDIVTAGGTFLNGGYTHTISADFGNPLAGRQAWSGVSGGFITTVIALPSSVSGQTIQLRWRCGTDNATGGGNWAIDDVGMTNILCCNFFAPVLPTQTNRTINELTLLNVTNTATDGDLPGDLLTYTLSAFPAGATISANGVITWTPSEAQGPMTGTFTTIVADKAGLKATNSFVVTVSEVNVAPVFAGTPPNRTINELSLLTVTNNATDSDLPANVLTYSLLSPPAGAAIDTNGVITWTPSEAQGPSTNTLVTVVSDGTASVTNSFVVTVSEVNVAPVFVGTPPNRTINELSLLTVTNNATDSDLPANVLTYSLLSPPAGAAIDTNGVITWTPGEAQGPSTNTLTTVVSDGTASVTNSFVVTVSEVNVAPVANNDSYGVTDAFLTVAAPGVLANDTDADVPANTLTAVLVSNPTNGVLSLNANGGFTYTPNNGFNGTDAFTYRANDGLVNSGLTTVTLTVTSPVFNITSITVSNQVAKVSWESVATKTYRLEYKTTLTDTSWTPVAPDITAAGSTTSMTNVLGTATQRYYRVNRLP
ncbi:MAG: Ig-like domain-containing protein [Verrucomicrobiota bacterium]